MKTASRTGRRLESGFLRQLGQLGRKTAEGRRERTASAGILLGKAHSSQPFPSTRETYLTSNGINHERFFHCWAEYHVRMTWPD